MVNEVSDKAPCIQPTVKKLWSRPRVTSQSPTPKTTPSNVQEEPFTEHWTGLQDAPPTTLTTTIFTSYRCAL